MSKKFSFSAASLLACVVLAGQVALAASDETETFGLNQLDNLQEFRLQPRFNLWGFTGDSTLAEGQFLVPLYGDQTSALYAAAEGNFVKNDSSWLAGGGLGYRQVVEERIWGGYVLGDYVSTPHNGFTIVNPGLEMLGNVWDVNINGYIPLDNRKKLGAAVWAGDDLGDYRYIRPTGHDYYDHKIQQYEEPARGFDFEVARVIPHFEKAKLHLGAYHFDTSDSGSTNGVETRLTYDVNKFIGVELEDTYDNASHNKFLAGIRFTFGGYSEEEKGEYGIATRLMDPIEHDEVVLSSSGLVPVTTYTDQGEQKEHDNVWFFKQLSGGGQTAGNVGDIGPQTGSGTAEDPFIGFTPGNYGAINPSAGGIDKHPLMYFAPGTYSFSGFSSRGVDDRFNLPNGWSMYGKTSDYKMPAMAGERAAFSGGLDLYYDVGAGTLPTTVDSIRVINTQGASVDGDFSNAALYVVNAGDVILKNVGIQNNVNTGASRSFAYGICANNSILNFEKLNDTTDGTSTVIGEGTNAIFAEGFGVYAINSTVNFQGGANSIEGVGGSYGFGIYANASNITFNGSGNTILGTGVAIDGSGVGIFANVSTVTFGGSAKNTIQGLGNNYGFGITADYSTINFEGSANTIKGLGNNYGFGIIANVSTINFVAESADLIEGQGAVFYGIRAAGSTINFGAKTRVQINVQGDGFGIIATDSTINFGAETRLKIQVLGGGYVDGIYASNSSIIKDEFGGLMTTGKITDYVDFYGEGGSGYKYFWDGHDTPLPW
jgi:hypothetical protein